ncbi:MAG: class I adenylate-forming enzyme family protein [Acidimicrobiales bacterium]
MTMDEAAVRRLQVHGQDVPALLALRAATRSDHPALVWDPRTGPGRTWTYHELWADVRRLAAAFAGRGIGVGDKVLLHADNCPELVTAWLACATVGAVAVTTNTKSVADEIAWFAEKAGCVAAVTQPRYASLVATASPALRWVAVTADDSGEPAGAAGLPGGTEPFDRLLAEDGEWEGRPVDPMLPSCIMFTSGTTSKPKAVVHTHANAVWASRIGPRNIDLGPDGRYLIFVPFFHVNAQTWAFLPVLGVGATAVLMPKWSTSRFWEVVARHEVSHFSLMPFCFPALTGPDRPATSSLRAGVFGLVMPEGRSIFGVDVYGAYGMTETVTHAISGKPAEHLTPRAIGRPTPGYEVAVVDKETGALCDAGETGELWLRGARGVQLFLEYFDNPEANRDAFSDGWFKTGDIVRMAGDGSIVYVERDKDLLKVGGENVSAREVEDVVATVAGVARAAVVGQRHEFLDQVPVAFVVKADGAPDGAPDDAALEEAVVAACRARLADFKVPRAVYVVDELPLGNFDKLLKNRLREMADERAGSGPGR